MYVDMRTEPQDAIDDRTTDQFFDKRFVVEDVLVEGDKVALRVTVHGVPTAPGESLPIIMEIFRIENGRVAEVWGAGTLRQHAS